MILLLLACATPRWTLDGTVAPARARLDSNHDGRVDSAEYARVAFAAPPFDTVDVDHDGDLSTAELRTFVYATDPATFLAAGPERPPDPPALAPRAGLTPKDLPGTAVPDGYYVLLVLRDEIVAANPQADVPTEESLQEIGRSEPLDGPRAVVALRQLEDAAAAAHLEFPAALRRHVPATRPPPSAE